MSTRLATATLIFIIAVVSAGNAAWAGTKTGYKRVPLAGYTSFASGGTRRTLMPHVKSPPLGAAKSVEPYGVAQNHKFEVTRRAKAIHQIRKDKAATRRLAGMSKLGIYGEIQLRTLGKLITETLRRGTLFHVAAVIIPYAVTLLSGDVDVGGLAGGAVLSAKMIVGAFVVNARSYSAEARALAAPLHDAELARRRGITPANF